MKGYIKRYTFTWSWIIHKHKMQGTALVTSKQSSELCFHIQNLFKVIWRES
jgi:hypothetical protein